MLYFEHWYTDNKKKCFLSSDSAYKNDFWRIMWHWRVEQWLLKFSLAITEINYKTVILIVIIFQYISVFTDQINAALVGAYNIQNLTDPKCLNCSV